MTEAVFTTLLSTADLESKRTESWVVVDCRYDLRDPDYGRRAYAEGHVPGAVYASLSHDLAGQATGSNGRHPLPGVDAMCDTFGRLGITSGRQVVAYDQDTGMFAARLWWMLRYLGHETVAVLDGGWAKWNRESRPVSMVGGTPPGREFIGRPGRDWVRSAAEVESSLAGGSVILIDARSPDRFTGDAEPIDRVGGHIPGATNHHYSANLKDDGTFEDADVLRKKFAKTLGNHRPDQAVCYCGSGVTACHNLLAMSHACMPGSALYVGSWSEWSSDGRRPVETGPAREG